MTARRTRSVHPAVDGSRRLLTDAAGAAHWGTPTVVRRDDYADHAARRAVAVGRPDGPPARCSPRPGAITAASVILTSSRRDPGPAGAAGHAGRCALPAIQDSPELADQLGSVPASFGTFILVLGAIMVAWGTLQVVAAIFVLTRRTWARITAMILAILGALIGLATIIPGENGLTPVGATSRCCSWAPTPSRSGRSPARDLVFSGPRRPRLADVQRRVLPRAALQHAEQDEGDDRVDADPNSIAISPPTSFRPAPSAASRTACSPWVKGSTLPMACIQAGRVSSGMFTPQNSRKAIINRLAPNSPSAAATRWLPAMSRWRCRKIP